MRTWLLALVMLGITTALAQDMSGGLNNSPQQLIGLPLNNSFGTIVGGGGSICDGSINLSQGCPQPMLGL